VEAEQALPVTHIRETPALEGPIRTNSNRQNTDNRNVAAGAEFCTENILNERGTLRVKKVHEGPGPGAWVLETMHGGVRRVDSVCPVPLSQS
jgi:hypothetical protein